MSDNDQKSVSRRRFLSVLGTTSAGAAVLSGCSTEKVEKLIPYLVQSEDQVPGIATWYASTCTECSSGCGLHVRTREGRAVKLEGNPEHPINAGRLCAMGQAGLQGLYNPGRIKGPMQKSGGVWRQIAWDDAIALLGQQLGAAGSGFAVLSGAPRGSFTGFLADFTAAAGGRLVRWEPFDQTALRLASKRVFGRDEVPSHDFAKARYIVSFGADFLDTWGPTVENQRQFAESHGFSRDGGMAKHVYFAPRASLTGLNADEWHGIAPGSETALALAMAGVLLGERGVAAPAGAPSVSVEQAAEATGLKPEEIARLAKEFAAAKPSLAVAGGIGSQHAGAVELCAAVHLLNFAAGNLGQTVLFGGDLDQGDGQAAFASLQKAMDGGQVKVLLVHEANPVYATPKAGKFAEALAKVPFKVSTSLFVDETSSQCDLILPGLHALERWDDANPRAGVWSLMQPVMEPVYPNRNPGDVLLAASKKAGGAFAKFAAPSWEAYLKDRWSAMAKGRDAAAFWRESLARGGVFEPQTAASVTAVVAAAVAAEAPAIEGTGDFTLVPYASSLLYDGRGTNKPWLLETPDPVTKITWHTWVELHPDAAARLNVKEGEILKVTSAHGSIEAPAYIYPGLRPDVVAIPMGFGHTEYGEYAKNRGANYLDLLGPATGEFVPYLGTRVTVERTHDYRKVAKTEGTPRQLGRGIASAMPRPS